MKLFHLKHLVVVIIKKKKLCFWQRPTFIAKSQSLPRQISQFQGHFENRFEKKLKKRIASNKCAIMPISDGPKFALSVLTRTAS